eukprot:scaffold27248_cov62-Phaeocystis_antarctica.AAC.3
MQAWGSGSNGERASQGIALLRVGACATHPALAPVNESMCASHRLAPYFCSSSKLLSLPNTRCGAVGAGQVGAAGA